MPGHPHTSAPAAAPPSPAPCDEELIACTAVDLVARLRAGDLTPHDLLDALEHRIAATDDAVNALPTRCFARARRHADRLLSLPVADRGPLCGMPIAIKDLNPVAGVRCTFGSPLHADHIPDESDLTVQRLERAGGIVYAKSNTSEFGAGAHTVNPVLGLTRNPWDLNRSAAGSSGGAAAALATGCAWLAQGSDNAGSLRTPASFCAVVGLRPAPGRVAQGPAVNPWQTLSVNGPMARNVGDLALLLDAMTGDDADDPRSLPAPQSGFLTAAQARRAPRNIAFSPDLGITPVTGEVADICRHAAHRLAEAGCAVTEAGPDLSGAVDCYKTLRAFGFAVDYGGLPAETRARLKPDLAANIAAGLTLDAETLGRAMRRQATIRRRVLAFMTEYDLLLTPAAIVPPFPVAEPYVRTCNGVTFDGYIDWLAIAYAVTLSGLPALSLPCGFTGDGLPVGVQMIGQDRGEAALLSAAGVLEDILDLARAPITPCGVAVA